MAQCIDRTDQTTLNRLALTPGPTVDASGAYTLNRIDEIAQEIADNISQDAEKNPVQIAVNTYGNVFYDATRFVNGDFRNTYIGNYPDLEERWDRGNITNLEFADFINRYNYTPNDVLNTNRFEALARSLDSYYKESFSSSFLGGLCNTIQSIFGAIDSFFDILGTIDALISDAVEFLEKIRSYDGITDFIQKEIIDGLIKQIKEKIEQVIRAVFKEIEDLIQNFNVLGITLEDVASFDEKVVKSILTHKEQMCAAISKDNQETFINKVLGTIDYLIGLLESPDLEQIQLIVARVCALAANVEALIRDIKSPLDDFGVNYQTVVRRVSNIGKLATSTAIRNGAIRYSPEVRKERINSLRELWDGSSGQVRITPSGNEPTTVAPITKEEYYNLPLCGAVIAGSDTRVKISGDWVEDEDCGAQGYSRVDLDVKVYLMRVQAELGIQFNIVSGWRSKKYNEKIRGDGDSSHLSGLVIDIENSGFDVDLFTDLALKHGFKTVVVYDNHIHLDIRERG